MKVNLFLRTVALVSLVFFASCRKDDDNNPSSPTTGPFVAKVDGTAFPTTDAKLTKAKYLSATKTLQIIGQPSDQKEGIILTLLNFDSGFTSWKPGTYSFDPTNITAGKYLASAEYNKWNGSGYDQWFNNWDNDKTGQIIIESITDTHVKGTFLFNAEKKLPNGSSDPTNVKKITEGAFDLDITKL